MTPHAYDLSRMEKAKCDKSISSFATTIQITISADPCRNSIYIC
ncbi:hypothetical protein Hanom_Chr05g00464551 [Helianthus anomalus]